MCYICFVVEICHAVMDTEQQLEKRSRLEAGAKYHAEFELEAATNVLRKLQFDGGVEPIEEPLRTALGEADVERTIRLAQGLAAKEKAERSKSPFLTGYFEPGEITEDVASNTRFQKRRRELVGH